MPDLGIGEGLTALFGGGDLLAGLFGGGEAAAAGAGAAEAAGATGALADLAGPTAFGTAEAFLDPAAAAASSLAGPTFAGTVADTLAPAAAAGVGGTLAAGAPAGLIDSSIFSTGTSPVFDSGGASSVVGGAGGATPSSPISSLLNANAGPAPGGSSVFNTGTTPITGVGAGGQAAPIVPGGGGVSGVAAPAGVTAPTDATAAAAAGGGTAAPAAGAGTAAPSSISQLLSPSNLAGSAVKSLTSNPLGVALGAGGLAYNVLEGQKQTSNQKALTADANTATANSTALAGQGEALTQYLQNGTLPPAYQQMVTNAIQDAKTTAISNAAANGQPTDPTKNTSLAAELAKIDASGPQMQAQVAQTLFSSGTSLISAGQGAANLSGSLYQTLVNNDTAAAANTGKAIATLAAALNGKTNTQVGSTNIQLSPAA